jgi:DNA-3-methyladenine glycosylase II
VGREIDVQSVRVPRYWKRAVRELSQRDATLARIIDGAAHHRIALRNDPFVALARAMVGQQISVKAAQSIWTRLNACVQVFAPSEILALEVAALRAAGLSERKAAYLLDLARHLDSGTIDPTRWKAMDDQEVIADLIRVKGIGRWTAEIFLIFHLQRPDVLPVDDLGIQRAISLHYNRGRPLSEARLRKIGQAWAPWRSVASWYLWRSLDAVAIPAK